MHFPQICGWNQTGECNQCIQGQDWHSETPGQSGEQQFCWIKELKVLVGSRLRLWTLAAYWAVFIVCLYTALVRLDVEYSCPVLNSLIQEGYWWIWRLAGAESTWIIRIIKHSTGCSERLWNIHLAIFQDSWKKSWATWSEFSVDFSLSKRLDYRPPEGPFQPERVCDLPDAQ